MGQHGARADNGEPERAGMAPKGPIPASTINFYNTLKIIVENGFDLNENKKMTSC